MNQRHHPRAEAGRRLRRRLPSSAVRLQPRRGAYIAVFIHPVHLLLFLALLMVASARAQTTNSSVAPLAASSMIEAAGKVDYSVAGSTKWQPASVGLALVAGTRVRHMAASLAAG